MATEKQIEANRQNAQKSTGPKTPEGKAKVSQNAVTHGLTAASPVLSTENPQQYDLFHGNLTRQLAPEGILEYFLAERAANLSWRLNRAQRYDTLIFDNLIKSVSQNENSHARTQARSVSDGIDGSLPVSPISPDDPDSLLGRVLTNDFHNRRTLEKIQRYEFRIERSFYRALRELGKLQFIRLRQNQEKQERVCSADKQVVPVPPFPAKNMPDSAIAQNKANFPLDIITQIENKRLRSRLLDKKAV